MLLIPIPPPPHTHTLTVVPSLLVPLMSPYKALRDGALSCLSVLQTSITDLDPTALQEAYNTNPLIHLIDTICKSKLEISTDPSSLQQLLWKLFKFETDFASRGGQSPGRRKSRRKVELKEKTAILEAILQSLLMHVVTMGASVHVQSVLLKMLVDVDHEVCVCVSVRVSVCRCMCACMCMCC